MDIEKILKGTKYEIFAPMIALACQRKGWTTMEQIENLPSAGLVGFDVYDCLQVIKDSLVKSEAKVAEPEKVEVAVHAEAEPAKPSRKKPQAEAPGEDKEN